MKTVVFLGAGATKACGGPLTSEILPNIVQARDIPDPASIPDLSGRLNLLTSFLSDLFHVTSNSRQELYPSLPLLMSLLDTAIERRQSFHPQWDFARISDLRQAIELGIFDLLEERLFKAPTNNHYQLLQTVFGPDTGPCILSTNYDLIIDTALMSFSQSSVSDGRFPDYGCNIRTHFYKNESQHFGTLLKLHGSLNWLYCKTCHRLEIGASESRRYINVVSKLVGPTLEQAYTLDGSPCLTCGTKLRPLLVAPTHLKDYRNPHLTQVWYEAERVLRETERIIFIGYSLPEDDVEVVYLLKRSLAHLPSKRIVVVEHDPTGPLLSQHAAGRRYRALFGDDLDWHPEGMDAWLPKAGILKV
jgi:hypothetical protein